MTRPPSPAERQRLRSPANLWRALIPLVLLVVVAVIIVVPRSGATDSVHVIDLTERVAEARQQAGFSLLIPTGLDPGWRATSSDFTPPTSSSKASFRVGYASPTGKYTEIYEGVDSADALSVSYAPLTADGSSTINGTSWDNFRTSRNRQLIRHTFGSLTVIVTGPAPTYELETIAAALK